MLNMFQQRQRQRQRGERQRDKEGRERLGEAENGKQIFYFFVSVRIQLFTFV